MITYIVIGASSLSLYTEIFSLWISERRRKIEKNKYWRTGDHGRRYDEKHGTVCRGCPKTK